MSFGYSVDFVAVSQLVADLIGSLRETGGSKSDYQEIILELEQLGIAIRLLDDLTEDSSIEVYSLKCAAASCRSILEEFHNKIKKYEKSLGQNASAGMVHKTWKKMLWLKERDYIDKVRTYLSMHQRTIQTMLIEYNLAGTKMIQENQNAIGEAVEATNERITDAAKNIERQGVLISASSVLLRHLYQLLNGDIKASLMEVAKYAKTTFASTERISAAVIQIQTNLCLFDKRWTYIQAEVLIEDPFGNPFRVPSEWTAEFLKVHIQNRFSRGAGKDEVEKGLYELNYRHNRELVLDLDDVGSVLRAQQNLIMSIMLLGSPSDDSNCPIDSCGSRNTELDPTGRRQCKECGVRFDESSRQYPQQMPDFTQQMRTIEKISEDDSAPRGRPRTENPKQLSKQNQTHIFRNVKIPKALKPLARQSLRRMAPIQLDPEKDLDSRDVPLYRNPQGNEKISTDAVKNAEKIAKEKADEEKEKAEGRVTAEKRYYFEEDDWEDDEAYLSGSSIGPGERYAGLPRRRASNLRCHLSVDYRGAYGNGAYKPDW